MANWEPLYSEIVGFDYDRTESKIQSRNNKKSHSWQLTPEMGLYGNVLTSIILSFDNLQGIFSNHYRSMDDSTAL